MLTIQGSEGASHRDTLHAAPDTPALHVTFYNSTQSRRDSMFVVYATHPDGDQTKNKALFGFSGQLGELPEGVEKIGEGVWYLTSIEQLPMLVDLGRAFMNSGLEFHVKGLSYPK